jgi:hypothetical protein
LKKPFPPKSDIEPIHVEELLSAAGMCNFLGVLSPAEPVPHLRKLVESVDRVAREALGQPLHGASQWEGIHYLTGFSAHAELLLAELARQHETLLAILTRAQKMNRSAARLKAAVRCRSDARFRPGVPQYFGMPPWRPVNRREQ